MIRATCCQRERYGQHAGETSTKKNLTKEMSALADISDSVVKNYFLFNYFAAGLVSAFLAAGLAAGLASSFLAAGAAAAAAGAAAVGAAAGLAAGA